MGVHKFTTRLEYYPCANKNLKSEAERGSNESKLSGERPKKLLSHFYITRFPFYSSLKKHLNSIFINYFTLKFINLVK